MDLLGFTISQQLFSYFLLPLFIFIGRISDVTIGTIRIIMISRGKRTLSAILGFFEVIIWLLAVTQVLKNLDNLICYIAYGGGFAAGNFIGISIENKLAIGTQAIQIIAHENMKTLAMILRQDGFGVTNLAAQGQKGQMDFLYLVAPRKRTQQVIEIVKTFDPDAFISVSDIRNSYAGYFSSKGKRQGLRDFVKKK